ncbi:uncharacterized protein LOC118449328 [Vespa mandarinia]|uniref:uncharacterized protein LOC118449328 n=1 Tax=Vespa mandarinia TaxID=7446 RepID=UPI00161C51D2|nr:uncharacterized protein LOC118449328 [Vespa mandarinia]
MMQNEEIDPPIESADSSSVRYMSTLPDFFNNTIGKTLKIENFKPQNIIEVLGDFLGIVNYNTNLASFWFLDILALQILRNNDVFDDYSRAIFISWLVGEIQLIRDNKFSREKFFEEMEALFAATAMKIVQGEEIPHWNLITFGDAEMKSEIEEEERKLSQERDLSSLQYLESKTYTPIEKISKEEIKSAEMLLDVIIRSTYDMYAGEVRYALVYTVFVEPIEIKVHNLPFSIRKPRPVRLIGSDTGHLYLRLREALQNVQGKDGKKLKSKKNLTNTKKQYLDKELDTEYPLQPSNSLSDEEFISLKRSFILPLIESNEAADIFNFYEQTV